jgi:hypothetical protein
MPDSTYILSRISLRSSGLLAKGRLGPSSRAMDGRVGGGHTVEVATVMITQAGSMTIAETKR